MNYLILLPIYFGMYLFWCKGRKYGNKATTPPNIWPIIPFVGNLPLLGSKPYQTLSKYGPIIWIQMGNCRAVVINDVKLIKVALSNLSFCGRPNLNFFKDRNNRNKAQGILFADGIGWQEQRHNAIQYFKGPDIAQRRRYSIQNEAEELVNELIQMRGKRIKLDHVFSTAALNSVWQVIAGSRFHYDDKDLLHVMGLVSKCFRDTRSLSSGAFMPTLVKLFPTISGYKMLLSDTSEIIDFIRKSIGTALELDLSNNADSANYIQQNAEKIYKTVGSFEVDQNSDIFWSLVDLFVAGTDTTSMSLVWAVLYLENFPEVHAKFTTEIDTIIGRIRTPQFSDRQHMPYTVALIHELMRICYITVNMEHRNVMDSYVMHYVVQLPSPGYRLQEMRRFQ